MTDAHLGEDSPPFARYPGQLCWGCFVALHPERAKSKVRKEIMILAELERRCGGIYEQANRLTWDCPVSGGCSLRRPDMLLDFGTWAALIEVDEAAHDDYCCWNEETRLNIIAADVQLPLAILRLKVDTPVACFGTRKLSNGEPTLSARPAFSGLMFKAEAWLREVFQRFGGECPPPPDAFLDQIVLDGSSGDEGGVSS